MKILTNKEQQKVCNAIVANTIIAFSLLDLEELDPKRTIDYTEHLIGNAVNSLYLVGGMKAVFEGQKEICNFKKGEGGKMKDYKVYKLIMRCIEITDHRSKNVDVKNLRVSLNECKRVKIPKGLTLKELRDSLKAIGRISVSKVDYSDKKEEDV